MARKNPFANLLDQRGGAEPSPALDYTSKGASRSLLNSISEMASHADKLMEGETIVELEPEILESSFVQDRVDDPDDPEFEELVEVLRQRGQDSPVLVRPHPRQTGRYMIVFGHRRVRAAQRLGRKVRAVVKELEDQEHVIAQGQENSARANLSFIEKALYAGQLAAKRYDDATIMAALSIDRTTLSKMLAVASIAQGILTAIGPAKGIGRDRWYGLKQLLDRPENLEMASSWAASDEFGSLPSDQRFETLITKIKAIRPRNRQQPTRKRWAPPDATMTADIVTESKRYTLSIKSRGQDAKAFGEYLSANIGRFYEAWKEEEQPKTND